MPRLTINTQEVKSFEPAEPGPYLMTVDEISDVWLSEEKKTPMVYVYFKFTDPAMDDRCGRVRRSYPVAGKGAGFFADFWKAATGEDLPIGAEGGDIDVDTDEALGKTVQVEVGNEKSNKPGDDRVFNTAAKVVAAE